MEHLTSAERKHLRGLAQRIDPAVIVGRNGLAPTVLGEIETALEKHELIKVRFDATRDQMHAMVEKIAASTGAACVGTVGRTAAFFRQSHLPGAGS